MIFSSNFLPCVTFFTLISSKTEIKILSNDVYTKQTYRNRAYILGANKIETLTVPVIGSSNKNNIKDIKIDNHENWQRTSWRTILAAYQKSPFFEYYEPYFSKLFDKKFEYLYDLNIEGLQIILKCLKFNHKIVEIEFESYWDKPEYVSLDSKNRDQKFPNLNYLPYKQNFGDIFVPNLSIIDLLFCNGPYSQELLKKSFAN